MKFQITPFHQSKQFSLELYEFVPKDGYETFLKKFCEFSGEAFIDWRQGVESGIGHISYLGGRLTVVWNDFPDSFSFDCESELVALSLQSLLKTFFES